MMDMTTERVAAIAVVIVTAIAGAAVAQETGAARAITARVHGTFLDQAGGLGVLSGDMTVVRFEVRNGEVTAIGAIDGALADSAGDLIGHVNEELALRVGHVGSTCNQLRIELAATDADVLRTAVHFDKEVAGFDSRDGATPKAMPVLCSAGDLLRKAPTADALAAALNLVAAAMRATPSR
jgi:hypothetical protein